MSAGPPTPYLRASDADREAAVERLHRAAVEGRLDHDELDERLAEAYSARWTTDLDRITADVTPPPPPSHPVPYPPPTYPAAWPPQKETNGLAAASLIAGIVWLGWFGSFAAVIFGHIALAQIKRSEGRQTGQGMAAAGLVLGYFWIALLLVKIAVP